MSAAQDSLRTRAGQVAAPGTDPAALAALVAWSAQPRHHPDTLRRRLRDHGDPALTAGTASPGSLGAALAGSVGPPTATTAPVARDLLGTWSDAGVRVALIGDPAYPADLAEGWPHLDPPTWLAWRGAAPTDTTAVAIVGARRATGYGTGVAAWLAEAVADAGVRVVSGGALGIDAAAHEAAVDRPGGTTVVLGCGHAVAYPRPHARAGGLFDRILEEGGSLLSEALPHEPPRAHQIRSRNRIVAGLARAVVVVEGGPRSGALLTAGAAAERGRTVLAVPGDVRAPGSAAPHRLLAEGAAPCCDPSGLLESLGPLRTDATPATPGGDAPVSPAPVAAGHDEPASPAPATTLPDAAHRVLAATWPRPVRLEDLAQSAGIPAGRLLAALTRARVNGEVADTPDGIRLRRAPAQG